MSWLEKLFGRKNILKIILGSSNMHASIDRELYTSCLISVREKNLQDLKLSNNSPMPTPGSCVG